MIKPKNRHTSTEHNAETGVRAKKSLGQNFLMHQQTADRIAVVAKVEGKTVLEIGPGTGMLTRALLSRAKRVIAVEADADLVARLSEEFAEEIRTGALTLIHNDIRKFDPASIGESYMLTANIPYYITGEIIRQFLTTREKPSSMTLLVQKEVAVRIAREKKESLLSLSVKVYGTPIYEFTVPRGAFIPAPKVDSAVLSVRDIRNSWLPGEEERFFKVLRAGFAHKRKLLVKNLEVVAPREAIMKAMHELSIPQKTRAEDLSLDLWRELASALA